MSGYVVMDYFVDAADGGSASGLAPQPEIPDGVWRIAAEEVKDVDAFSVASAALMRGRSDIARPLLDRVIALGTRAGRAGALARLVCGILDEQAGDPAAAETHYRSTVGTGDSTLATAARAALAGLLKRQGAPAEAETLFREVLGTGRESDQLVRDMAAVGLADILREQGIDNSANPGWPEVRALYRQGMASTDPRLSAHSTLHFGNLLAHDGDPEGERMLRELIARDGLFADEARLFRADRLASRRAFASASESLRDLRWKTDGAVLDIIRLKLALVYLGDGHLTSAREVLRELSRADDARASAAATLALGLAESFGAAEGRGIAELGQLAALSDIPDALALAGEAAAANFVSHGQTENATVLSLDPPGARRVLSGRERRMTS
jgi:hypothetical protein